MSSEISSFIANQFYTQSSLETEISPLISPSITRISDLDKILEKYVNTASSISSDYLFSIFGSELDPRRRPTIQQILTHRNISIYSCDYYVKLIGKSYHNCQWVTENFIIQNGGQTKLKEYKKLHPVPPNPPYYDPDYEKIDKILGKRNGNEYLVKWCKLDYEQSTWETRETIQDDTLIQNFLREQIIPTAKKIENKQRPNPILWKAIRERPISRSGLVAREYQLEGLNFLMNCWYHCRNCILADEMGLGKTLQSILFLNTLHNKEKVHGPFLIVVPLSTIQQWTRELNEWSDFKPLVYTGEQIKRIIMKVFEFYYENTKIPKFDVLLTTYETILRDPELATIKWQCIIIDEAHRLKNSESKLLKIFRSYQASFKILLTGTPIQNKTQELWSLLNFLDPTNFSSLNEFEQKFGNCNEMSAVHEIQNILRPIMLRRLKSDVEKAIAPLEEVIIDCPMTMHQKAYYKAVFMKNLAYLTRGAHSKTNNTCLRNISMDLRKVCNHPYLLKKAEEQILIERKEAMKDFVNSKDFVNESLIRSSGKMILLDKLLTKLKSDGHRVLIFSQMQIMLDILSDYLNYKKYSFERIDGSIRSKERQEAIDKFNDPNSKDFVFLLCTKAGGVGINLTSADTVIIYDSDWNPQNDIQATARCHRIGQTKEVKAYRFITADSYERKMFDTASMKLGLDKAVLESSKFHNQEDMDKLIRLGAYHALEDDSAEIEQFGEEDIENIISRSQRIKHENVNGESTFSKAEFKIEDESVPVALYKPEFWKKYVPEKESSLYIHYNDDDYSDTNSGNNNSTSNSNNNGHFDLLNYVFDSDEDDNQLRADPEYWNRERLQLLMHQIVKLGFNKWDKVIHNIELNCEESEVKAVSRVILGWLLLNTEEDSILQDLYQELHSKSTVSFEKEFSKKKRNDLKNLFLDEDNWRLKRIELLYCIDRLVQTCPSPPNEIVIPEIDKAPPTNWWEKKHDQQLMYYVSQNGIQSLGKMTFDGHQEEVIPKKVLLSRLNLLNSVLIDCFNQYKNSHKNEVVLFCHDVLHKAVTYWSPKDQKTVIRFLCLYGYPGAEKFKFVSGLRNKTEIMIDLFVKEIISYCQAVQSISKSSKSGNSKSSNETTDDLTAEYDESTTVDSTDVPEFPLIEHNNFILQPISRSKALHILTRCKFFEKVREFVNAQSNISEIDKNLIQYVSERGFLNPSESQAIHAAFGETPSDTRVIKRIENLDRNFFGKKPLKTVNLLSQNVPFDSVDQSKNFEEALEPSSTVSISNKFEFQTDENGNAVFPISLSSSLILVSLGKIVYDRPNFHTKRYIYPDGFISEHLYGSVKNPKEKVWYQSLIVDKGGENPVFRVQLKDNPEIGYEGNSPSNPWLTVFRKVSQKKGKTSSVITVSGPEFYGLSHPLTHFLIRKMDNANKCQSDDFPHIQKVKIKKKKKVKAKAKSNIVANGNNDFEFDDDLYDRDDENDKEDNTIQVERILNRNVDFSIKDDQNQLKNITKEKEPKIIIDNKDESKILSSSLNAHINRNESKILSSSLNAHINRNESRIFSHPIAPAVNKNETIKALKQQPAKLIEPNQNEIAKKTIQSNNQISIEKVDTNKENIKNDQKSTQKETEIISCKPQRKKSESSQNKDKRKKDASSKKTKKTANFQPPSSSLPAQLNEAAEAEPEGGNEDRYNAPVPLILNFPILINRAKANKREEDELFEQYGY